MSQRSELESQFREQCQRQWQAQCGHLGSDQCLGYEGPANLRFRSNLSENMDSGAGSIREADGAFENERRLKRIGTSKRRLENSLLP